LLGGMDAAAACIRLKITDHGEAPRSRPSALS
jgi:hypothetical protein